MSSGNAPSRFRRTYYVKKDFQKRFIMGYAVLVFLGIILANIMLYVLLTREIDKAYFRAHISITSTGDVVRPTLFRTTVIIMSVSLMAVWISVLISAGKIRKVSECLSEGIEGLKKSDFTVRVNVCNDSLADVGETFNRSVNQLNSKMASIKDETEKIEEAALGLKAGTVTAEEIIKAAESTEKRLSEFRIRQGLDKPPSLN